MGIDSNQQEDPKKNEWLQVIWVLEWVWILAIAWNSQARERATLLAIITSILA
jgi:hypothetical protein